MNTLTKRLLEKNAFMKNAVLTGKTRARVLGGVNHKVRKNLYLQEITRRGFSCIDEQGSAYTIEFDDLEAVDGQDLVRYAKVFNIKPDGSAAKIGKKRGRKPKSQVNTQNGDNDGKDQRNNTNNQTKSIN